MKSAMCKFLMREKCLLSSINAVYSWGSGLGKLSFDSNENNEELLLSGVVAVKLSTSESDSASEATAMSCLSTPVDLADMVGTQRGWVFTSKQWVFQGF